jgi:hypothetical protein
LYALFETLDLIKEQDLPEVLKEDNAFSEACVSLINMVCSDSKRFLGEKALSEKGKELIESIYWSYCYDEN